MAGALLVAPRVLGGQLALHRIVYPYPEVPFGSVQRWAPAVGIKCAFIGPTGLRDLVIESGPPRVDHRLDARVGEAQVDAEGHA